MNGFDDREQYLESIADPYDVSIDLAYAVTDILGPDEDFDGLVAAIGDFK